jgi:hypothetical protein
LTLASSAIARSLELAEHGSHDLIRRKQTEIEGMREIAQIEKERRISMANREDRQALMQAQRIEAKKTQDFTHLLSPDILDLIVDHLIVDNPSVACKIGAVRRSWRGWMLARPGAWQNLELGGKRPLEKAKLFTERGGGIFRSLNILQTFPSQLEGPLAEILRGHVGRIKRFVYIRHPSDFVRQLAGQFNSLEEIMQLPSHHPKIRQNIQTSGNQMDTGVDRGFKTTNSSLKTITLVDGQVTLSSDSVVSRRIQSFTMRDGSIRSAGESLIPMAQCMPDLENIALENISFLSTGLPLDQTEATLDRLRRFSVSSTPHEAPDPTSVIFGFFDKVNAPNLQNLSVWRYTQDLSLLFRSTGLATCLSRLQGLDIGHTIVNEAALLGSLKNMPELRFLDVSCTALGDTFLQGITHRGIGNDLLPNLTALSIAALDITSLALRDLAVSRLPKSSKIHLAQPTPSGTTQSQAFRPLSSVSKHHSQESSVLAPAAKPASIPESTRKAPRRFLKWLCLDHCETIDHQLIEYLRTKILFVSAGKVRNEERIRGLGRYRWDLDYFDSCLADDPKERCKLVAIPGKSLVGSTAISQSLRP